MGMNDDFFRDYGFGNYYQGTSKNTSGQFYDPANYGGRGAFNPSDPTNANNINPYSFYKRSPLANMFNQGNNSTSPWNTGQIYDSYMSPSSYTINRESDYNPIGVMAPAIQPNYYGSDFWEQLRQKFGWTF